MSNTRDRVVALLQEAIELISTRSNAREYSPAVAPSAPASAPQEQPIVQAVRLPSCPGGPKAFNEYFKKQRPIIEKELGDVPYVKIRERIAANWKATCSKNRKKKVNVATATRKNKTPSTPGRVNAPVPLATPLTNTAVANNSALAERSPTPPEKTPTPPLAQEEAVAEAPVRNSLTSFMNKNATPVRNNVAASLKSKNSTPAAIPEVTEAEENSLSLGSLTPANKTPTNTNNAANKGYTDLGLDDTLGMRKIRVGNRNLFMTNSDKGLFERDEDDSAGGFVGYLRNGAIEEADEPTE